MSKQRLGPRGVVGKARAKAVNVARFVIQWLGWRPNGDLNLVADYYLTLRRGKIGYTTDLIQAKHFSTRGEAAQYCKAMIRTRIFGGNWQSAAKIVKV